MDISLERIVAAIEAAGFVYRGGFHPRSQDAVPGRPGTALLVGNAGPRMWDAFRAVDVSGSDPLDVWTRSAMEKVAKGLGCRVVFPFDGPPHLHFLRWALRSEPVQTSPLGAMIHPDYGLWHAYRGALLFEETLDIPLRAHRPCPCDTCADKPCMTSCPVRAFRTNVYDVAACVGLLDSPEGRSCMTEGCLARRACAVGREWTYGAEQMRFHMASFLETYKPSKATRKNHM